MGGAFLPDFFGDGLAAVLPEALVDPLDFDEPPFPKILSQPSEYFWFVPTRVIVTARSPANGAKNRYPAACVAPEVRRRSIYIHNLSSVKRRSSRGAGIVARLGGSSCRPAILLGLCDGSLNPLQPLKKRCELFLNGPLNQFGQFHIGFLVLGELREVIRLVLHGRMLRGCRIGLM